MSGAACVYARHTVNFDLLAVGHRTVQSFDVNFNLQTG